MDTQPSWKDAYISVIEGICRSKMRTTLLATSFSVIMIADLFRLKDMGDEDMLGLKEKTFLKIRRQKFWWDTGELVP